MVDASLFLPIMGVVIIVVVVVIIVLVKGKNNPSPPPPNPPKPQLRRVSAGDPCAYCEKAPNPVACYEGCNAVINPSPWSHR